MYVHCIARVWRMYGACSGCAVSERARAGGGLHATCVCVHVHAMNMILTHHVHVARVCFHTRFLWRSTDLARPVSTLEPYKELLQGE